MLTSRYMSASSESKTDDLVQRLLANPLHLPDGKSFVSATPKLDVRQMIALSEKYLSIINSQPDFVEKKKRTAIDVPFVL